MFLTAGPSVSYSTSQVSDGEAYERTWLSANLGVSAQLAADEGRWSDHTAGVALTPDVMFWLDDEYNHFIHFSMDFSFFDEGQSIFGFLAWEKTW